MANLYKNKVVYGETTLIDLTDATATADKILSGYTAYGASGEKLTGTYSGGTAAIGHETEVLPGGGTAHYLTGVDLINDTVDAAHLAQGYTAHDSAGNAIVGTMSGGGSGGSGWIQVYSTSVTVNYTNKATRENVLTHEWTAAEKAAFADKLIYVRVRDRAGKRNGYLYGGDYYISPTPPAYIAGAYTYCDSSGDEGGSASPTIGLYARTISRTGSLIITAYMSSSTSAYVINGTFDITVYAIDTPV